MKKNRAIFKTVSIISIIVYGLLDLMQIIGLLFILSGEGRNIIMRTLQISSLAGTYLISIMSITYYTIVIVFIVFSLKKHNPKRVVKGAIIWCILQTVVFLVGFVQCAVDGEDIEAIYSSVVTWIPVILPFVYLFGGYKLMD
ncbi:MAG: hypothetical protein PHN80_12115 [Hespellia sp.]|nr:hypothetical protein [Hespellia sp.]